jgi:Rieske Fe-S protein
MSSDLHDDATTTPAVAGWRRRDAFRAAGAVSAAVAGAAGLTACGGDAAQTGEGAVSDAAGAASGAASAASDAIAAADVPVGGGIVIDAIKTVVTQPTDGDYKAFSAVCTHQGCLVNQVTGGKIICPCHGSAFDISTGEVVQGPATQPLAEKSVTVDDSGISVT